MKRTEIEMFNLELDGKFGEVRKRGAVEEIAYMEKKYENGELVINDGGASWVTNGAYIPMHCLAAFLRGKYGHLVDAETHERLLNDQNTKSIQEYKERMKNHVYSEEELFEMRSSFGEGVEIVDVITGNKIRL